MSNVTETAVQETVQPVESVQEQTQTESTVNSVENKKESSVPPSANLIPAPIPTSSPWKSVNNDIPVTSISVEDFESLKKKSPTPSIKSHTSTKWVPIKASITVSNNNKNGNKNKNQRHTHNGKRNSNNNNNKNKQNHSKKNKKNSNQNKKQEKTENGESSQPVASSTENTSSSPSTTSTTTSTVDEKQTSTEFNDSNVPVKASEEQPQQPQQQHSNSNNNRQKRFNNKYHSHHFNNNNNRKFHNKQPQGQTQNGFTPRHNNNNTNFRHSNNNQKHHSFRPQQMAQLYSMLYPFHYSMMAVNSVARQIEYYLSDENFATDDYLKQQLSKDGYVPLSLLSKFYRLLNMSFGGDLNIIMAALREIVFNENATVEVIQGEQVINPAEESNLEQEQDKEEEEEQEQEQEEQGKEKKSVTEPSPLTKYFIRSKNWEKWLPEKPAFEVEIHKTLSGNDLDEFMLKMVTVPHHHNHRNHNHHSHRNHRNHQQQKSEEREDENSTTESNESTNEGTVAEESTECLTEQDNASTSTTDVEKSIPIEDTSKEGSVPVEVNQSS